MKTFTDSPVTTRSVIANHLYAYAVEKNDSESRTKLARELS